MEVYLFLLHRFWFGKLEPSTPFRWSPNKVHRLKCFDMSAPCGLTPNLKIRFNAITTKPSYPMAATAVL